MKKTLIIAVTFLAIILIAFGAIVSISTCSSGASTSKASLMMEATHSSKPQASGFQSTKTQSSGITLHEGETAIDVIEGNGNGNSDGWSPGNSANNASGESDASSKSAGETSGEGETSSEGGACDDEDGGGNSGSKTVGSEGSDSPTGPIVLPPIPINAMR